MNDINIVVSRSGLIRMIHDDRFDPRSLGISAIERGSYVEPSAEGDWTADLSPVNGPTLGPFSKRSEALTAEVAWLHQNWLIRSTD